MTQKQHTTRLIGHIRMKDSRGNIRQVAEWRDFVRLQLLDNTWSEWSRAGGRFLLDGQHVNATDEASIYEIAATAERLWVVKELKP